MWGNNQVCGATIKFCSSYDHVLLGHNRVMQRNNEVRSIVMRGINQVVQGPIKLCRIKSHSAGGAMKLWGETIKLCRKGNNRVLRGTIKFWYETIKLYREKNQFVCCNNQLMLGNNQIVHGKNKVSEG